MQDSDIKSDIKFVDNNNRKPTSKQKRESLEQIKELIEQDKRLDMNIDEDQQYFSGKEGITPEEFIQNEFKNINRGKVPESGIERAQLADKIILRMGDEFSGMGVENASNFVRKTLPNLTGEMIPEDLMRNAAKLNNIGMTNDRITKYFKAKGQALS